MNLRRLPFILAILTGAGCVSGPGSLLPSIPPTTMSPAVSGTPPKAVAPDVGTVPLTESSTPSSNEIDGAEFIPQARPGLASLTEMTVHRHPKLAASQHAIDVAKAKVLQAGLYPNPTLSVVGDELGDRTGPEGIWTAPEISQEIVTANKLQLEQSTILRDVELSQCEALSEKFKILAEVWQNYWNVIILKERIHTLRELIALADRSVENAQKLLQAKEASELDVIQLEVDRERYRAELASAEQSLPLALQTLAASCGVEELTETGVAGRFSERIPVWDRESLEQNILANHPEVRSALLRVCRARLVLERALAETTPNVTVSAGFVHQGQNNSNDWRIGASVPIPLWNKNQGNILAARSALCQAEREVEEVRLRLRGRLAQAIQQYVAARSRFKNYQMAILPKAVKSLELSQRAYQGGQFEYLRVLQAQRAIAETRLEYLKSLGETWQASSVICSLSLDDRWVLNASN